MRFLLLFEQLGDNMHKKVDERHWLVLFSALLASSYRIVASAALWHMFGRKIATSCDRSFLISNERNGAASNHIHIMNQIHPH